MTSKRPRQMKSLRKFWLEKLADSAGRFRARRCFAESLPTRILLFLVTLHSLFFIGCLEAPVFQAQQSIPQNVWAYPYKPAFQFDITDTAARYNAYFLIRHTDAYPFSNIWVWAETREPGDSTFKRSRIEVPLADRKGAWLARGDNGISTGAIWEHRAPLTPNGPLRFTKTGRYTIRFEQAMRTNPLPEVLQIGVRIEKR